MAESEKPNSSPGKAKAKSSFLDVIETDEDMSNDFLSSWKSMSAAGGNDMDFNFEPVAKGNKKKAFGFGMDMDFSLDDAFGKMPSFKLDVPDIDFSSSPKKSSKSKEKETEEESTKGSRQTKNDKFSFSFDFNGFDDFNLDKPKTKGENKATGDKDNKQASPEIECKDSPRQTASCSAERMEDATHNELPTSKVAVNSKPGSSVEHETSLDVSSCKSPSNTTIAVGQQKGTEISMDIEGAEDAVEADPDSSMAMETSLKISGTQASEHDFSANSQSNPSHMLVGSEEAYESPGMDKIMPTQGVEEDNHRTEKISNQVFAEGKEQLHPTPVSVIKVSAKAISSHGEVCFPNGKLDHGSEAETLREEIEAAALLSTESRTLNSDRSLPPMLTENKDISIKGKMVGVVERQGNVNSTLDTVASSIVNFTKTINVEVSSITKLETSCLKDPPTQSDGEPNAAKAMLMRHKLSGGNNFSKERSTNDGAGTKLLMLERSKKGSTPLRAAGSGEGSEEKLEDDPRSSAKQLMKQELSGEKKEQNADALSVGNRKGNEEIKTKMVVDSVQRDGQAKKDSFRLPMNRKMSIDVKPLGLQLPSLVTPEWEAKSSNQSSGQLKDKMFSTETIQKLNGGQVNRLSSARTDKIMPSLPSLRMSRNVTTSKLVSSSVVQDTKTVGHERIPRLQVKSKIVSPVNVQKQTPPIPSLKRKSTEAADLHPSKRLSPSESNFRMPRVSAREVENEVRTQRAVSEGSKTNTTAENLSPKFDFHLEANMEALGFTLMAEGDANVEKAEACAKELDDICSMLKKKHDEAKELLVRALVNNNNLLMLNHPICDEKIRQVQKFASRLMSMEQEAGV